jgi:hypothetical protein
MQTVNRFVTHFVLFFFVIFSEITLTNKYHKVQQQSAPPALRPSVLSVLFSDRRLA